MVIVKISEEQLNKLIGIKLVNCNTFVNRLYKYMPLTRVIELLDTKELSFVDPKKWYDPYEIKYLETDYSRLNNYKQPKIYCLCARQDTDNEEASWRIYKKEGEPLLRLKINALEFFQEINQFANSNNCSVYLSKIDYSLKRKEIDDLYKENSPKYHDFFDDFNDEKYIRLMSLKRRAYNYENEYRIFIIPENPDSFKDNDVLKIPINPIKVIERITINPAPRVYDDFISQLKSKSYLAEYAFIKKTIQKMYPEMKVFKSTLYKSTDNVVKI